jgi:hypothetical protein
LYHFFHFLISIHLTMESTTDPTTETTVEPNDSPLSNLDLWCDWSGSPEDPVSVTIAMEVKLINQASSPLFGTDCRLN